VPDSHRTFPLASDSCSLSEPTGSLSYHAKAPPEDGAFAESVGAGLASHFLNSETGYGQNPPSSTVCAATQLEVERRPDDTNYSRVVILSVSIDQSDNTRSDVDIVVNSKAIEALKADRIFITR
jgi:hypothetical protein